MELASLEKLSLRKIWPNEATDFTPWLAANIDKLGSALGLDLEWIESEAPVGGRSLDLLARDLSTSQMVIIENQLTATDHDHLGKLLTYAAGYSASIVIWVADSIRDEHRQALEWLNQRTDQATQFFGVVVEVMRIDDSRPALNIKPVVLPNEWQKSKKGTNQSGVSEKGERYRSYFQGLIDELREKHKFTGAKVGQPQNWYSFSSGIPGVVYSANFGLGSKVRAEIYIDTGEHEHNKTLFDKLKLKAASFESEYGCKLSWERLDEKRASRIAVYREGLVESSDSELEEIQAWHVENLLKLKKVFAQTVKRERAQLDRSV